MNEDVLVPLAMFAAIFGIVYVYFTARNKERMAMIEKGVHPATFTNVKKPNGGITLKIGMLAVGIALGLLIGEVLYQYAGLKEEVAYFSMIFLFGGAGLIANAIIEKKVKKD